MSARRAVPAFVVVFALGLSACAGDDFGRAEAISVLSLSGTSEAEATCMADTLSALGQLDAADPRQNRDDVARQALVAASTRCVSTAVLPRSIERKALESAVDQDDPEGTPMESDRRGSAGFQTDDPAVFRPLAIARLRLAGRTQEHAACVVDHLIQLEAQHLLNAPKFGMGFDPLEADAFASCP